MTETIVTDNVWGYLSKGPALIYGRSILGYTMKGYHFTPAGRKGWNGHVSLVDSHGRFPAGLTAHLMEKLAARGVSAQIQSTQTRPEPILPLSQAELAVTLEQHQQEAVRSAVEAGRGVVWHPVAAGKSYTLVAITVEVGVPTLALVHTKELMYQLAENYRKATNVPGLVGVIGDGKFLPNFITVATYQSIRSSLKRYPEETQETLDQFQCVLGDEIQHVPAKTFAGVMQTLPNAWYRFGCSATPFKSGDDETFLRVTGWTGPVVSQVSSQEGVEIGRLVPAEIYMVEPGGPDPDDLDYQTAYESGIVMNQQRNELTCALAARLSKQGPVLVLTQRIEHGQKLAQRLREAGYRTAYISGESSTSQRNKALNTFRNGEMDILVASIILDEGVNMVNMRALILAGGGLAVHRQLQRIGRGMRADDGKESVIVIDWADRGKYLGRHARARLAAYRKEAAYSVTEVSNSEIRSWL